MRWLSADHADHISFMCLDDNTLTQEHLIEPSTQGGEANEAFGSDVLDHEADLVHVGCQHHSRPAFAAPADQAADVVLLDLPQALQETTHHFADLRFITRDAVGLGQDLQQPLQIIAHRLPPDSS
jgi:hypothetical protein